MRAMSVFCLCVAGLSLRAEALCTPFRGLQHAAGPSSITELAYYLGLGSLPLAPPTGGRPVSNQATGATTALARACLVGEQPPSQADQLAAGARPVLDGVEEGGPRLADHSGVFVRAQHAADASHARR
eukprot:7232893-Prymnesium_polylepis.3